MVSAGWAGRQPASTKRQLCMHSAGRAAAHACPVTPHIELLPLEARQDAWQAARPDLQRILDETRRAVRSQPAAVRLLDVASGRTGTPVVLTIACNFAPARRLTVTVDLDGVQLLKQWTSAHCRSHEEPVPVEAYQSVDPRAWIRHLLAWVDDASAPPEEAGPPLLCAR